MAYTLQSMYDKYTKIEEEVTEVMIHKDNKEVGIEICEALTKDLHILLHQNVELKHLPGYYVLHKDIQLSGSLDKAREYCEC